MPIIEFYETEVKYNRPLGMIGLRNGNYGVIPEYVDLDSERLSRLQATSKESSKQKFSDFLEVGLDIIDKVNNRDSYLGNKNLAPLDLNSEERKAIENTKQFFKDVIDALSGE